jgi:glycosyltransferase involved in cell wall biosynthesis
MIAAAGMPRMNDRLGEGMFEDNGDGKSRWPTVTLVYLVYNRRNELRTSLTRMLRDSDYERELVDVIVVDNASTDGSAAMVREEFPEAQLIVRDRNVGVSGWNDGLAAARGDFVLALDDDCYLPSDGLRRAVAAALEHQADMVSFKVISTHKPDHVFTDKYRTGLFMFWGCAILLRRPVVDALEGYDPEIFVWGNELEFTLRFFDHGFRHLHLPGVVAQHMKPPPESLYDIDPGPYRINARHFAYIAAKLLRPRDSAEAFVALLARDVRDAIRVEPVVIKAVLDTVLGFIHGLRHRAPLRNAEVSRFYRRNFETFASPWWLARPPGNLLRALPGEVAARVIRGRTRPEGIGRRESYFDERATFYPDEDAAVLEFDPAGPPTPAA